MKCEAPQFNKKARQFEEQESMKASKKRKSNPRYEDSKDDADKGNRTVKRKKNTRQVILLPLYCLMVTSPHRCSY